MNYYEAISNPEIQPIIRNWVQGRIPNTNVYFKHTKKGNPSDMLTIEIDDVSKRKAKTKVFIGVLNKLNTEFFIGEDLSFTMKELRDFTTQLKRAHKIASLKDL